MNRLRTRWTAWPIALLMVLSLSGVAGASALISFKQPATHVAQTSDEDQEGDNQTEDADDQDNDEDAETDEDANEAPEADEQDVEDQDSGDAKSAPSQGQLGDCNGWLDTPPADGTSHGEFVSQVAHDKTAIGGPNHNHGWCVSRAAHGDFVTPATGTQPTNSSTDECGTADSGQSADVEDQDVQDATTSCADKAAAKAEKAKANAEKKAEKAKKAKFEHGKRRGKGHRP